MAELVGPVDSAGGAAAELYVDFQVFREVCDSDAWTGSDVATLAWSGAATRSLFEFSPHVKRIFGPEDETNAQSREVMVGLDLYSLGVFVSALRGRLEQAASSGKRKATLDGFMPRKTGMVVLDFWEAVVRAKLGEIVEQSE